LPSLFACDPIRMSPTGSVTEDDVSRCWMKSRTVAIFWGEHERGVGPPTGEHHPQAVVHAILAALSVAGREAEVHRVKLLVEPS
jgi:hypothetical protein